MSEKPVKIVVAQRGFVVVGYFEMENLDTVLLTKARCIRRWGTTKGLAELVAGPTKATVLDAPATERLHILTTVRILDCDAAKWREALGAP